MNTASFYSTAWPKIENLRPSLRPHANLHRQHYRGDLWYVLEDRASGKFFRFTPAAYALIGLMDGQRTVGELYDLAAARLGDALPSQDEVVQLMAQLHGANVLTTDVQPDLDEIAERQDGMRRRKLMQSMRNPLGLRIGLLDPDPFLTALMPLVRPIFSWTGFVLWCLLLAYGLITVGIHWQPLTHDIADRVLSGQGLALLAIAYPLVKVLHELGHGFAVKRWGGEVHEMGVMMLVFMPVPYVDASASTAYQDKRRRMVVSGAGIMVELALASLAAIAWTSMEPGALRALMFNIMLIGGVSTLLFNGNPLLRFDGYYVLADWIEIPNLGTRANRYLGYLTKKHLFGLEQASSPVTARGEAGWFVFYGIAAFCYGMGVMIGIALFVAGKFFFIGIALAIWSVVQRLGLPISRALIYLFTSPDLEQKRRRALAVSGALVALVLLVVGAAPIPHSTVAQGVVWARQDVRVVAGAPGFVTAMAVPAGATVKKDEILVKMADPLIASRAKVLRAEYREGEVRLTATEFADRVQAEVERERLRLTDAELGRIDERLASLAVTSPARGRFYSVDGGDLEGRYVHKGELIGYVVGDGAWIVRVAVSQRDIDQVQRNTRAIDLRFAGTSTETREARLVGATPRATVELPSAALSTAGGGKITADPSDGRGQTALESVFLLDLAPVGPPPAAYFGERVYARFDHGTESVAEQLYRAARQVFLRRFEL